MRHEMRAEYEREDLQDEQRRGEVKSWHMVRIGETVAMCGRALAPGAATLPETELWSTAEPFCHTCGAMYLREVP